MKRPKEANLKEEGGGGLLLVCGSRSLAEVADRWLDVLFSKAADLSDEELVELIVLRSWRVRRCGHSQCPTRRKRLLRYLR